MTTEDDFQHALDANPDDHNTRLVFADWLQERGDPRADGYRAIGRLQISPCHPDSPHLSAEQRERLRWGFACQWWWCNIPADGFRPHLLPRNWHDGVSGYYNSRREAEDAAALAFAKLPARTRTKLLAVPSAGSNG